MGAATVREVLWAACGLLNDSAPQFRRWPESELVKWLDDAQLAVLKYLPSACARVDAFKLAPGTKQSIAEVAAASLDPGDGSTAPTTSYGVQFLGLVRNMGADGVTPGRAIRVVDRDLLDAHNPDWHAATAATAVKHFVHDPQTPRAFYVTPPVHASTAVWVDMEWIAQPAKILNTGAPGTELYLWSGASATKLGVHDINADDCVNYIVARALMKSKQAGDINRAAVFAQLFTGSINAQVSALTGHNPNLQRLPFAPEPQGTAS